ncbi:KRI1-like protein [Leptotrombidium deliense]|uniref:Protein KRI1 homolog n=1 Tax=Leptotrombidium deliense TaxID=299467 RepID=A0A443SJP5_9ACAR|nr:KRI1-like protein [Leptotrombidium deliense]
MAKQLFEDDGSDEDLNLTLNEDYASRYETWRRKEEIQKFKDKYGEEALSESSDCCSDSAEDEESSEEEPQLNDVFDEEFFKVFAALKRRDAKIYEKDKVFFSGDKKPVASTSKIKNPENKKMSLKDYHINLIEKRKGITEEDEEPQTQQASMSYYEELNDIKNELKAALSDEEEENDNTLLTVSKVIPYEIEHSNKNVLETLNDDDKNISFMKKYWSEKNNNLEENEKFLRDYIVNKRYLESEFEDNVESVSFGKPKKNDKIDSEDENEAASTDESKTIKISKYHFEEPDANTIKRYPRNVESVRDVSSKESKATKRSERRERKKKEKESELQKFRDLKRAEIKERLEKLAHISRNDSLLTSAVDVDLLVDDDTDFDPNTYDDKMRRLFDEQYYSIKGEQKKPEFEFVAGIDDMEDEHEEQPSEFQNLIGKDLPTRFKYRKVPENDFGLTSEELLFADDKELNKWVSLKKISQYRTDDEEQFDQKSYATKKSMLELKKKIFKSIYGEENVNKNEGGEVMMKV